MNQYVYTVQIVRRGMFAHITQAEQSGLDSHQRYLDDLLAQGTLLFSGATPQDDDYLELVVFQAQDDAAASTIVEHDPAVQQRIVRACLYPYRVALWNHDARTLTADQQHFLYWIQPVRPGMLHESTTFEDQTVGAHFYYLRDLTNAGKACLVGRTLNTDHSTFGIGILRSRDLAEAETIAESDPAVVERIMRLRLAPFVVNHMADHLPA
jgi:uncharacterized protein YciI